MDIQYIYVVQLDFFFVYYYPLSHLHFVHCHVSVSPEVGYNLKSAFLVTVYI